MRHRIYHGPSFTPLWVLIGTNVLLFIVIFMFPALRYFLGLHPGDFPATAWTMVTSLFIHHDIWHVMANMLTLFFFGRYLSLLVGEKRFLAVYFTGGILGNMLLLLLAQFFPFPVAYGASGAVFAVAGALTLMRPRTKVIVFPIPAPIPLWVAVIGGFLILSLFPNVAWQAHLGGLVVGLISGYLFRRRERFFF